MLALVLSLWVETADQLKSVYSMIQEAKKEITSFMRIITGRKYCGHKWEKEKERARERERESERLCG